MVRETARKLQGAAERSLRRRDPAQLAREDREAGPGRRGGGMTVTGADGRTLSARGVETRSRLLEAAESIFGELGYHDASIVKITEAAGVGQGTFYLYFATKKDIFDELVRDLNRRIRHAMAEQAKHGSTRIEEEILGFK